MKIKELHEDIARYLDEDCYCPNEVYSLDGLFYQNYYSEQDCKLLGKREELIACLAHPSNDEKEEETVVLFFIKDGKCYDSTWYDATAIMAGNIKAHNIKYFTVCFAEKDIICNSIKGKRKGTKHFVFDGKLEIKDERA